MTMTIGNNNSSNDNFKDEDHCIDNNDDDDDNLSGDLPQDFAEKPSFTSDQTFLWQVAQHKIV